jgi:prepilin-type N-terminal cleavage/methylation domain-containing protein
MQKQAGSSFSRASRGFTLTEVLVAMAIFGIVFVAALLMYDRSNRIFKTGVESADMQQNTRVAFDKMVAEIRMAGYDYDRDGFPTAAGQAQQPDEQIEYAHRRAITFRANLDFADPATSKLGSGRESALEMFDAATGIGDPASKFPIVTTGNHEIVTYALQSVNGTNPDTITFFADVTDGTNPKRQAYPGGQAEDQITIDGVDLCTNGCNSPPYTLMRITLNETGQPVRTPLANNIRSMTLTYFNDSAGTSALNITDPGGGQWSPTNPAASAAPRAERSRIKAVGLQIIGMNDQPDPGYRDPNETLATANPDVRRFRKYRVETLVAPRNLGKRGMREQQTAPPGIPTLNAVTFGYCGTVLLEWTAPPESGSTGTVEGYVLLWDENIGSTSPPVKSLTIGSAATQGFIAGLDPTRQYRFTVAATNSWGTTFTTQYVTGYPKNRSTQEAPSNLIASGRGEGGDPLPNQIVLSWTPPAANLTTADQGIRRQPNGSFEQRLIRPEASETRSVEIWRSTTQNFNLTCSGNSCQPVAGDTTTQKVGDASGAAASFIDTMAANCTEYFYRIRIIEHCVTSSTHNESPGVPVSDFYPPLLTPAIPGYAETTVAPAAPLDLRVGDVQCSGNCDVELRWPMVAVDVNNNPIMVNSYRINITRDGSLIEMRDIDLQNGLVLNNGVASYVLRNLAPRNGENAEHRYEFTVEAEQCGSRGVPSMVARYPACNFANGGTPVATVSGSLGGSGSFAAPFEIESDAVITVASSNGAMLQSAKGDVYDIFTGARILEMTAPPGTSASFQFVWPAQAQEGAIYRVDYTIVDAQGCAGYGTMYMMNIQISCLVQSPAVMTFNQTTSVVTVPIRNTSEYALNIIGLRVDWNEENAQPPCKNNGCADVWVQGATFPTATGRINATLTGDLQTTGTFTATAGTGVRQLDPNDTSGNYTITVTFADDYNNQNIGSNPIISLTIIYKLPIDSANEPARECLIFP